MQLNNCPSCGGKVEFSPDDKGLKCEKCSNIFPIEYKKTTEKRPIALASEKDNGFEEWKESKRSFQCGNCGAQVIMNKYEMTTICSYCNTHSLVPIEDLPGLKPDIVIPFKIGKEKAKETFKVKTRQKMFLPNDFKRNIPKTKIGAIYLSSFFFEIDCFANYDGIRAVTRSVTRQVHTANGWVTERDTEVDYVPFSGSIQKNYNNILIESSDKIKQSQIDKILPYFFKESCSYDDDFLVGYNVGYYNKSLKKSLSEAENVALSLLDSAIRRKHDGVRSLNIYPKYQNQKYSYALLPLYFINFKYKDKEYLHLMNGQTGQTTGELPRSATKITFFTLFIVFMVVGLPLLIILLSNL